MCTKTLKIVKPDVVHAMHASSDAAFKRFLLFIFGFVMYPSSNSKSQIWLSDNLLVYYIVRVR